MPSANKPIQKKPEMYSKLTTFSKQIFRRG